MTTYRPAGYEPSPILRYFDSNHLRPPLDTISTSVRMLAEKMDRMLPPGAEKSAGLRKLLEAKDCFVRAGLDLCDEWTDRG